MKIAIIGSGIAGYHVLNQLLKNKKTLPLDITVFDDQELLGRGRAFQQDDEELLLNYPSNLISLKKNKDDDFYKWVQKNCPDEVIDEASENKDDEGNIYFSRQLFGSYVHDYFTTKIKKGNVTVIENKVERIEKTGDGYTVTVGDATYTFDYVFLTNGQLPPQDIYHLSGTDGYFNRPFPLDRIEVEQNKDYAVIGTGLSGLDCIRYLHENGVKPLAVSRDGQVQAVRGVMDTFQFKYFTEKTFLKFRKKNNDTISLKNLIETFKKECEFQNIDYTSFFNFNRQSPVRAIEHDLKNAEAIGRLQAALYYMQQLGSKIWPYMTMEDQTAFKEQFEPVINANSNPMPEPSAQDLLEWLKNKEVTIKSGIESIDYKYKKYRLYYKDGTEDRVHYIINATGPSKTFKNTDVGALLNNLQNDHLIIENPDGGILVLPEDNRIISPKYGVLDGLIAVGPLTGGVNYGNNGVYELNLEATRVVSLFLERCSSATVPTKKSKNKS